MKKRANHLQALTNLRDREPLSHISFSHYYQKVCFMKVLATFHQIIEWVKMRLTLVVHKDFQKDTMEV
jgi:hypothetical protein